MAKTMTGEKIKINFELSKELFEKLKEKAKEEELTYSAFLERFLEEFFMNDRIRPNNPHIDYTISGLTLDDMMKYNVKSEYVDLKINENYVPQHSYRDLLKYTKEEK